MGNGLNTFFWIERGPLKMRFEILFLLNLDKMGLVAEIVGGRNGVIEWKWRWRRGLFQWELDQLRDLQQLISSTGFKGEGVERWV